MCDIDEVTKTVRVAETPGWRIKSDRLITPGAIEGMLGDRHQLDMCKAHVAHIIDQLLGEFVIIQKAAIVPVPAPGTCMNLIDRQGLRVRGRRGTSCKPRVIAPAVGVRTGNHGGGVWTQLGLPCVRIRLPGEYLAIAVDDLVLVMQTTRQAWNEQLPDTEAVMQLHPVLPRIPVIEIAHHRNARRLRCPYSK